MIHGLYIEYDLNQLGLLPNDWITQIMKVIETDSYLVHLDGKSSTSREPENSVGSDVSVVDGNAIFSKLNWLYDLYAKDFLAFANEQSKEEYVIDNNLIAGININYLKGENSRYEWHVDSNPLTGLLFVTDQDINTGGELFFKLNNEITTVYPKSGYFILFDARNIPHAVNPLKGDSFRISIPMNYYFKEQEKQRPSDLDDYIYKKITK